MTNRSNFELLAGLAAIGGSYALVLTIGILNSANSATLTKYVETSHYKACLTVELKPVCDSAFPEAALK